MNAAKIKIWIVITLVFVGGVSIFAIPVVDKVLVLMIISWSVMVVLCIHLLRPSEEQDETEPLEGLAVKIWRWLKIILPPSMILLLALVRPDHTTLPLYFTAFILFFIALVRILIWLGLWVRARYKKIETPILKPKNIMAILILVFFSATLFFHALAAGAASKYAMDVAKKIQAECVSNRVCSIPEEILEKTTPIGDSRQLRFRKFSLPFYFYIRLAKDKKEFSIGSDRSVFRIDGGVDKPLG